MRAYASRLKDLIAAHVANLGGRDLISEAEFCIVRRAALLTLELELLEARFEANAGAKASELELYQRCANATRRLLESLALQRRQRDMTTLDQYLRTKYGDAEDAEVLS